MVIVAGMRAAEAIVVPFLLSVLIAIISAPSRFWLERKGLPKWLAMLGVIGVIGVIIKTAASLGTGIAIGVWLAVIGVDYAMLFAAVQFGPGEAPRSAAGYLVVNVVAGSVVEPCFMGRGFGLWTRRREVLPCSAQMRYM